MGPYTYTSTIGVYNEATCRFIKPLRFLLSLGFYLVVLFTFFNSLGATSTDSTAVVADQIQFVADEGLLDVETIDLLRDEVEELVGVRPQRLFSIDKVTREELTKELGLSDFQARAFIDFRKKQPREAFTLERLKEIPGWDRHTILRVAPHFYKPKRGLQDVNKKHPLHFRIEASTLLGYLYERNLFLNPAESTHEEHQQDELDEESLTPLGRPIEWQLRATIETATKKLGLLADKDFLEPFLDSRIPLFDRYSFFYAMERPIPYLKQLIVGDYAVSVGQGLIANSQFMRGPYSNSLRQTRPSATLRPRLAPSGYNHFRGLAMHFQDRSWELLVALSTQPIDASTSEDLDTLKSIQYDAPHRTEKALSMRRQARERNLIARFGVRFKSFSFGLNASLSDWQGKTLATLPGYSYNEEAKGITHSDNISLDATYLHPTGRLAWATEVALSQRKSLATVSSLTLRNIRWGEFFIAGRLLAPHYFAHRANSFFRQAVAGNEAGLFVRFYGNFYHWLNYSLYTDFYTSLKTRHENTPRLQVSESALCLNVTPSQSWHLFSTLSLRWSNQKASYYRVLIGAKCMFSPFLSLSTRLQYKHILANRSANEIEEYREESLEESDLQKRERGFIASLIVQYKPYPQLVTSLTAAHFNTTSFATRLYLYAPRVRYSAGSHFHYGRGYFLSLLLRYRLQEWRIEGGASLAWAKNPIATAEEEEEQVTRMRGVLSMNITYFFSLR